MREYQFTHAGFIAFDLNSFIKWFDDNAIDFEFIYDETDLRYDNNPKLIFETSEDLLAFTIKFKPYL